MKNFFGIQDSEPSVIGPAQSEIENLLGEIHAVRVTCAEKTEMLERPLPDLQMTVPVDSEETILRQNDVDSAIRHADNTNASLERQNHSLIEATELLQENISRQQKAHSSAVEIVRSFSPPDVMFSQSMQLRALSIAAEELVHTRIFEDASRLKDRDSFDIAVRRVLNVNTKNNQGRNAIDYATEHMFAHGITALIENGATSADALLYSLRIYLPEAAKLLVVLTGQLVGYGEIFSKLPDDNILVSLDLSSTHLTSDAVICLSSALTTNTSITSLNISDNDIGTTGCEALGKMLAINTTIGRLYISNVNMGYEGIKYIASPLESSSSIKVLDVSGNNLREEGAITLARLIEKNGYIIDLDIASNHIMDIGAAYILDRLSRNHSILRINLANNQITDALVEDIVTILKQNSSVIIFTLDANQFSKPALGKLEEVECKVSEANLHGLVTHIDVVEETYSLELLADLQQVDDF